MAAVMRQSLRLNLSNKMRLLVVFLTSKINSELYKFTFKIRHSSKPVVPNPVGTQVCYNFGKSVLKVTCNKSAGLTD